MRRNLKIVHSILAVASGLLFLWNLYRIAITPNLIDGLFAAAMAYVCWSSIRDVQRLKKVDTSAPST